MDTPAPPPPERKKTQPLVLGIVGAVLIAAAMVKHPYVDPFREALAGLGYALGLIARGNDLLPRKD